MDLCKAHAEKVGKSGWHGKVTGEIPEDKLKQFERHAAKSSGTGEVGAGGGGGLTRLRRAGFALPGVAEGGGGEGGRAGGSEAQIGHGCVGAVAGTGDVMAISEVEEGTEGRRVVIDGMVRGGRRSKGRGRGLVSGRGRVVTGFGSERVEDVRAQEEERDRESYQRQRDRNEEFARGRVRDFEGRDLDRSEGSAFSWRR